MYFPNQNLKADDLTLDWYSCSMFIMKADASYGICIFIFVMIN
jgi:hypothetical protein